MWFFRVKKLARMRFENNHASGSVLAKGFRHRPRNQCFMPPMHTIEIANREDAAARALRNFFSIADDDHGGSGDLWCNARSRSSAITGLHPCLASDFARRRNYSGRAGTIIFASPSRTTLPRTVQKQSNRARFFAGIKSTTITRASTSSPTLTGALKFNVCDT